MKALLACAALCMCVAAAGGAEVVFNNFGPGETFNTSTGWTIGTGSNWEPGNVFKPSKTGNLLKLDMAVSYVNPVNMKVDITLYDTAGGLPNNVLEAWKGFALPDRFGQPFTPFTLTSVTNPLISSTQDYVVAVSDPTSGQGWAAWNQSLSDTGPRVYRRTGVPWTQTSGLRGAMRVWIPEPATLGLLALGLLGVARRR